MQIDRLSVVQYAYVDRDRTCVLSIVENPANGQTYCRVERYEPYPLYDCAVKSWEALKSELMNIVHPRVIRVNSNILGVFKVERTKKGEKVEMIYNRKIHDNELSAAFAAYRRDDGEQSETDRDDPERENEASGDENESQSHYH